MNLISRANANIQGLKFYFTGKPCPQGHISERRVISFGCMQCERDKIGQPDVLAKMRRAHQRRRSIPEGLTLIRQGNKSARERYKSKPDKLAICRAATRANYRKRSRTDEGRAAILNSRRKAEKKRWASEAGRNARRTSGLKWVRNNPDKHNANVMRYRTARLRRTPVWASQQAVLAFYEQAKNSVEPVHIDHIYPIRSSVVSGLHTADNLCVLPQTLNTAKSNRIPPALLEWHKPMSADEFREWAQDETYKMVVQRRAA
jgi:hypothetical protein